MAAPSGACTHVDATIHTKARHESSVAAPHSLFQYSSTIKPLPCGPVIPHLRLRGTACRYPGTMCSSNEDGTYKILYDDGDIEHEVAREFVRTI